MSKSHRIDNFTGTQKQYIAYLEHQVFISRQAQLTNQTNSRLDRTATRSQDAPTPNESESLSRQQRPASLYAGNTLKSQWGVMIWKPYPRSQPAENPLWKTAARKLVNDTPKASEWADKTQELGVSSDACAITFLIDDDFQSQNYMDAPVTQRQAVLPPSASSIEILKTYAKAATQRLNGAHRTLRFTRFSQFLILSACLVLLHHGTPKEDVLAVVTVCVGREISEKYCMDILRTVRFLNKLIDTLDSHGWNNRGSELLLIWNRSIASYHALSSAPNESLQFLQEGLCGPPHVHSPNLETDSVEGRMSLFIPSLVHTMTRKKIHVARISHILGYGFASMLTDELVNPWQYFNGGPTATA